jgi:hypothetical protein
VFDTLYIKLSPDILPMDGTSSLTLMPFGWSDSGSSEYILRGLALKQVGSANGSNMRRFERCGVFQVLVNDDIGADEFAKDRWRSLLPFYSTFTSECFQII